ncbi:hypothetical protein AAE478_006352 [Parahypoxylon ruwenzoriense]
MPPIRIPGALSRWRLSAPTGFLSPSSTHIPSLSSNVIICSRTLSVTAPLLRQTPSHRTVPLDEVPEYPYGRFTTYKVRNEGLFGESKVRFGNVVAEKHGNRSRTRWHPNRHNKRLWSPALGAFIRTRLTTSVLKTIDRLGGIDEYLLGSKTRRLRNLGPAGWALRWKIMQTPAIRERFARERAALGLPPKEDGSDTRALPQELAAQGVASEAVLSEIDGMLERGDEFVIGEAKEGEEMIIKGDAETSQEATEATRDIECFIEKEAMFKEDAGTPKS